MRGAERADVLLVLLCHLGHAQPAVHRADEIVPVCMYDREESRAMGAQ